MASERLTNAISEVDAEIRQNAEYLEFAQMLLLSGVFFLFAATALIVARTAYGIAQCKVLASPVVGAFLIGLVAKAKTRSKQRCGKSRGHQDSTDPCVPRMLGPEVQRKGMER